MNNYKYYIGGSLPINATSYVKRKADYDLYQGLKNGDFCYVLNSRQMGKSSLRIKTIQNLEIIVTDVSFNRQKKMRNENNFYNS